MAMTFAAENLLEVALGRLHAVATQTIQMHAGRGGRCVACGRPSPCDQAILADHNLELTAHVNGNCVLHAHAVRITQG